MNGYAFLKRTLVTRSIFVFVFVFISLMMISNSRSQDMLDSSSWPAGSIQRSALPKERAYSYQFDDVKTANIERLLNLARVELPVKVAGKLAGWLWVQRAQTGWLRFSDYRLEGEISSPLLGIDRWQIAQAKLRFGYMNRAWYVSKLAGDVITPGNPQSVGRAELAGSLNSSGSQQLKISGTFTEAKLQPFLDFFGLKIKVENQPGSVSLSGSVPWQLTNRPDAWIAIGKLSLPEFKIQSAPSGTLNTTAKLDKGGWSISDGSITIGGQSLSISAQGMVVDVLPYSLAISGSQVSLSQLLNDFDLPQLARRIDGEIGFIAKILGNFNTGIQSGSLDIASRTLNLDGESISDIQVAATLPKDPMSQPFIINLRSARIGGGTVEGNVAWSSLSELNGQPRAVELRMKNLSLKRLTRSRLPFTMDGVASGQIKLGSQKIADRTEWSTTSQLNITGLGSSNLLPGSFDLTARKEFDSQDLRLSLRDEKQTLESDVVVKLKSSTLSAISVTELDSYSARGSLRHFMTSIQINPSILSVPIDATGNFEIQGDATNWLSSGSAELRNTKILLAERPIDIETVLVNVMPSAFRLERLRVFDPSGRIAGSVQIQRIDAGEHLLALRLVDVDVTRYLDAFVPPEFHGAEGVASLDVRLRKPAAESDLMSGWSGTLNGILKQLQYRAVTVGELAFEASIQDDTLHLDMDGDVLGGVAEATVELPQLSKFVQSVSRPAIQMLDGFNSTSIVGKLQRIQLKQLFSLYYGQQVGVHYDGIANLDFSNANKKGNGGWSARLDVPTLSFERNSLAKNLTVNARYLKGVLFIDQLDGGFAGGRIEAIGELDLTSTVNSGTAQFQAEKLKLGSLVAMLNPKYASYYSGELTYRGQLQMDRQILLSGHARILDGRVYDLPIEDAHGNLKIVLSPLGVLQTVESSSVTGTALGGRLNAKVKIRGGARYELETSVKIDDGRLDELSRSMGFEKILGTGKFSAAARVRSEDFLDPTALTGPIRFRFEKSDAQSAPLISELARLAPLTQFASTDIQNGTVEAELGQGQVRIRHFLLNSDAFTFVAQGNAVLMSGRLDLEAILQNGGSINQQLAQRATQKLLSTTLPQLFIVSEINDFIRNRAIYFHVGGTTSHPSIQPRPIPSLAKALIQNIQRQLLSPTIKSLVLPGK